MNCKNFELYASAYIDDCLTEEEKKHFEEHINKCSSCKVKYNNLKIIINTVNEIEEIPLPKDFNLQLEKRLKQEVSFKNKKKFIRFNWKFVGGIVAVLLLFVVSATMLDNFSSRKLTKSDMAPMEIASVEEYSNDSQRSTTFNVVNDSINPSKEQIMDFAQGDRFVGKEADIGIAETVIKTSRKIIQRGRITIETEDFDEVHEKVLNLIEDSGGYIQHSEVYYYFYNREKPEESLKNANMELRVPTNDFSRVFQYIKELGVVTEENISGEDITESYMDIDNQVENLKLQEERLRELLKKADKVEDLLQIENELNRIRTQINYLTNTLRSYDNLVSMATINLNIRQVKAKNLSIQPLEGDLWSRAKNNFISSINKIIKSLEIGLVGLFGIIPIIIVILALVGPIGYFAYKRWKSR